MPSLSESIGMLERWQIPFRKGTQFRELLVPLLIGGASAALSYILRRSLTNGGFAWNWAVSVSIQSDLMERDGFETQPVPERRALSDREIIHAQV